MVMPAREISNGCGHRERGANGEVVLLSAEADVLKWKGAHCRTGWSELLKQDSEGTFSALQGAVAANDEEDEYICN